MKKIFLGFLILIVGHLALIMILKDETRWGIYRQQDNILKIEDLLLGTDRKCNSIIIGSSIAARFENAVLPEGYCNFALVADTALTALVLIEKHNLKFEKIYIEANVIRSSTPGIYDNVIGFPLLQMKKYFPPLRMRNQTLTLIFSFIKNRKNLRMYVNPFQQSAFDLSMRSFMKEYDHQKPYLKPLDELDVHLQTLIKKNIRFKLVYFPLHPLVQQKPYWQEYYAALRSRYSEMKELKCPYIESVDGLNASPRMVDDCKDELFKILKRGLIAF